MHVGTETFLGGARDFPGKLHRKIETVTSVRKRKRLGCGGETRRGDPGRGGHATNKGSGGGGEMGRVREGSLDGDRLEGVTVTVGSLRGTVLDETGTRGVHRKREVACVVANIPTA